MSKFAKYWQKMRKAGVEFEKLRKISSVKITEKQLKTE